MTKLLRYVEEVSLEIVLAEEQKLLDAPNTTRAKQSDIRSLTQFLSTSTGQPWPDLSATLEAWQFVTFEMVKKYAYHLLLNGYTVATVNRHLSSIRTRVRMASQAGFVESEQAQRILSMPGYTRKQAKKIDGMRERARRSTKKETATEILVAQSHALKRTGQAKDRLLLCLMLDHGLRVGEVATLRQSDINGQYIKIVRHKTQTEQNHRLSDDTKNALRDYLQPALIDTDSFLFPSASAAAGHISTRTIDRIVRAAGQTIGVDNLSCHDCRHAFMNHTLDNGNDINSIMQAGGWTTYDAALRYIRAREVANEGVRIP